MKQLVVFPVRAIDEKIRLEKNTVRSWQPVFVFPPSRSQDSSLNYSCTGDIQSKRNKEMWKKKQNKWVIVVQLPIVPLNLCYCFLVKKSRAEREENFSVSEIKLGPLWDILSWSPLPLSEKVEKADLWKSYRSWVLYLWRKLFLSKSSVTNR